MIRSFLLLFFTLASFANDCTAQAFRWAKQLEAYSSLGEHIVVDNNHNVITAGYFVDSIDMDPGPATLWREDNNASLNFGLAYLSKLDSNGTLVWGHVYNHKTAATYPRIYAMDVDDLGNIIVVGYFRDSLDLDFGTNTFWALDNAPQNAGSIFIAKYNMAGGIIWGKTIHSNANLQQALECRKMKVDHNNDIILSGFFNGTVDFDPGLGVQNLTTPFTLATGYIGHKYLLKLDANGNFVWVRTWYRTHSVGSGIAAPVSFDVDAANNILLSVGFYDSIDVDPQAAINMVFSKGVYDIALLKLDANGSLVWHKEIGEWSGERLYDMATDPSGNIYYYFVSYSDSIDMDPGPNTNMFYWNSGPSQDLILKLNSNGNFVWALKNITYSLNIPFNRYIATDTASGLYLTSEIAGGSNYLYDLDPGPGAYIVTSPSTGDIAFQYLDANGIFGWGGIMAGSGNDKAFDITTDNKKGVYLTGRFNNNTDFDPTPSVYNMLAGMQFQDAFIVKLNYCNKVVSQILQGCDSVVYNGQSYFSDTVFQYHYPAANGCDSAHAVVIDIATYNDSIPIHACETYTWNNILYSTSGYHTQNFTSVLGCDSTVTIDLTISPNITQNVQLTICTDTMINGVQYSSTGLYAQNYTSQAGCDSILKLDLTRVTIDTSVNYTSSNSLMANATNATYQWLDCGSMQIIPGATSATYTATQWGTYACIVTQNGCTDTTACKLVLVAPDAVSDYTILSRLYPNPSAGSYQLQLDKNYHNVQLEIRTIRGQLVWEKSYPNLKETTINLEQPSGVYMLHIKAGSHSEVRKLLKL